MRSCFGAVEAKDGAGTTLDLLGTFVPGASTAILASKLVGSYLSANLSGVSGDRTGAQIGAAGTLSSVASLYASDVAATSRFGGAALRAIPIVGNIANGVSLVYDASNIYTTYTSCRSGAGQ